MPVTTSSETPATGGVEPLGSQRTWTLRDTDTDVVHEITGELIGAATSRGRNRRSPSLWFEVRIIRVEDGDFVVSLRGCTTERGETDRHAVHRTESAYTVIELLTQHNATGAAFIPRTSRIALSEAAHRDERMEEAWIDRAVT